MLKLISPGVFGEAFGEGTPNVLALHGWGRDRRDFSRLQQGLSGFALDLPGFGSSPAPPSAWSTADYARVVLPVLGMLSPPRLVVGHSFGGRVAVQLADLSEAVDRLVLVGTPLLRVGVPPRPNRRYAAIRWLAARRAIPHAVLERARVRYGSEDYVRAQGVMREVLVRAVNESYETQLRNVKCETILVSGEFDDAVPPEITRRAARYVSASRVVIVEGAGHLIDDEIVNALRPFLNGGASSV